MHTSIPAVHRNRFRLLPSVVVAACLAASILPASAQFTAVTDETGVLASDESGNLFSTRFMSWGPKWGFSAVKGTVVSEGETGKGKFTATLAGTNVPITLNTLFDRPAARKLRLRYELEAAADTAVTLCTVAITFDDRFNSGKAFCTAEGKETPFTLPLGKGSIGKQVTRLRLVDPAGKEMTMEFTPAVDVASDRAARIVLASDQLPGHQKRSVEINVGFPGDVTWYSSPEKLPSPANWDKWFAWQGKGPLAPDSALRMSDWLDAPAGKFGRITSKGDQLIYNGKPVVMWGINVCYGATAPEKELADARAQLYADYGINTVRFHKYADRGGRNEVRSDKSFTAFNPEGLDRMDYFISKLKEKGIYVELSPTFGTFSLGPDDAAKVPYYDEMKGGKGGKGGVVSPHAGAYLGTELRDLQIEQMVNLMKHKNPYTGMTYAEDPAIMVVELLNEQSALFAAMHALTSVPTLRKRASERFTDWLLKRYGSKEAVLARWGAGALNSFATEGFTNESFEAKNIAPAGNPWFFNPEQLDGSQSVKKARLLDTMQFLYELQNEFYATYTKALRDAGYKGEIVGSNWQAGRAFSHYYNLHSDALAGIIDRHNYFGGTTPMVTHPCSGLMSVGMQQVADRPFMFSEWIHVFPTLYQVEGPAIIGAYGMGLQGWDVSYMFQNGDKAGYDPVLGATWQIMQPQILGIFPAVARQVLRRDVKESEVVVKRSVHVPSLHEGKLGFDDQVTQGYDEKTFDSKTVPVSAQAAVRSVVSFDDTYQETPPFDLTKYIKNGAIVSSNNQLSWMPGKKDNEGYFTINTPGTKAVVGFAQGKQQLLGEASITVDTPFAAVYLTASEKSADIKTSKRLVLVTIARTYNDGMKYADGRLLDHGKGPIRVEPVRVEVKLQRPGTPTVHILDHSGKRTGKTIPVKDGNFIADGAVTQTCYYEISY